MEKWLVLNLLTSSSGMFHRNFYVAGLECKDERILPIALRVVHTGIEMMPVIESTARSDNELFLFDFPLGSFDFNGAEKLFQTGELDLETEILGFRRIYLIPEYRSIMQRIREM